MDSLQSKIDPSRHTIGAIYRDAQLHGERGVIIGDVNHEIKKGLVQDINEALEMGEKQMNGKPFYLAVYEKQDLVFKRGLVRLRKITPSRPYPEQDSMVFKSYPGGTVYFCWALPHRSEMKNILMNPNLYPPEQVRTIKLWETVNLEHFGFKKDEKGRWKDNEDFKGDLLLRAPAAAGRC